MIKKDNLVLVVGGSSFIASHIILQLLKKGYLVRTTLRTMSRQDEVREMMKNGGATDNEIEKLSFVQADLTSDKNWDDAMKNVDYVIDVASPTPSKDAQTLDEMVKPAKEGLLLIMQSAKKAKVKKFVLTSAFGAVGMGQNKNSAYTEEDWSNLNGKGIHPYQISKTIAEKEAWKFTETNNMRMTAINPVGVMGPTLGKDHSHSNVSIIQMLQGKMKNLPKIYSDYVDVRDVASLHILAMESDAANGNRYIASTAENLSMRDIAEILKKNFPNYADKISTNEVPNLLVKTIAKLSNQSQLKMIASLVGKNMSTSNKKATEQLNWQPRSAEEAIVATAQSLIDFEVIK